LNNVNYFSALEVLTTTPLYKFTYLLKRRLQSKLKAVNRQKHHMSREAGDYNMSSKMRLGVKMRAVTWLRHHSGDVQLCVSWHRIDEEHYCTIVIHKSMDRLSRRMTSLRCNITARCDLRCACAAHANVHAT